MLFYILLYLWLIVAANHIINLIYLYIGIITRTNSDEQFSVVIPCRNEEENINDLLNSIIAINDKNLRIKEIIVVDDCSTDNTGFIAKNFKDKRIKYIKINKKPDDWNGKNYACWKGATLSSASKILFLDADLRLKDIDYLQFDNKYSLGFIYPEFVCVTPGEKLIIPAKINFWYLFISPMYFMNLNYRCASASGYFLYVDRKAYINIGGHKAIKGSSIEDVDLAKLMVKNGYKIQAQYNPKVAKVRMYNNYNEGVLASTRNYYKVLFSNIFVGLLLWLFIFYFLIFPFFILSLNLILAIMLLLFVLISLNIWIFITYQKITFSNFLYSVMSIFVNLIIYINSFYNVVTKKKVLWKGREVL